MTIVIELPFSSADKSTVIWANEEDKIDFMKEPARAARCTLSFAAVELKDHLSKIIDAEIVFASQSNGNDMRIKLDIQDSSSKNGAFIIEPLANGLIITGLGRAGVLYGTYEFLRIQGWRWLMPGPEGDCQPDKISCLKMPASRKTFSPSFDLGRGFVFEGISKESASLWLWMARNRMNISGYRPATGPLCEKLGMSPAIGGHIFASILHPDRVLPSGKSIWEEHQEWYGLPLSGVREKATAQNTQFCVSQDNLVQFLGNELLLFLNGVWKNSDRVDVWGFDTWGATCNCDKCKSIGNSSDQTVYLLSKLRDIINRALKNGSMERDVRLVMCAYEGTATISAPEKPVPLNLIDAGDYITFYPIKRCYSHNFNDPSCSWNSYYNERLKSWFDIKPVMPVMMGEYYNVSKFEDLPLLFTKRITSDLPTYYKTGVRGITYMHLPLVNWGMRTLTQLLYAQLSWDVNSDVNAFLDEYFKLYYGPYSKDMRKVYELLEESWAYSSQWRAWGGDSVLSQLQAWDGRKPDKPLPCNDHVTYDKIVSSGRGSLSLMDKALGILNNIIKKEQVRAATDDNDTLELVMNPVMLRELEMKNCKLGKRLSEDRRLMIYGADTMRIMTELVAFYDALYRDEKDIYNKIWDDIELIADKMDSYYMPITYEALPGLDSRDALTRSQVGDCIRRCRKYILADTCVKIQDIAGDLQTIEEC